jgi:hypothetical protein
MIGRISKSIRQLIEIAFKSKQPWVSTLKEHYVAACDGAGTLPEF